MMAVTERWQLEEKSEVTPWYQKHLLDSEIDLMIEMFKAGVKSLVIAEKLNMSPPQVTEARTHWKYLNTHFGGKYRVKKGAK